MTDYTLIKDYNKSTGQLPDKLTLTLPAGYAWIIIKQLIIQLEMCAKDVTIEIYGTIKADGLR